MWEAVSDRDAIDSGLLTTSSCSLSQILIVLVMEGSCHSHCATLRRTSSSAFSNDSASTSIFLPAGADRNRRMLTV